MQQNDKISSAILEIVKNDEHPIPAGIIISKLINSNVINQSQKTIAYQKIDELIHSRVLKQLIQSKKIVLNHSYSESKFDKNNAQTGTIAINNYGSGFITSDLDKTKKYFVNKNDTNNALSGDVVEFSPCGVVKETEDSLPHAIVGNVIKHNKDYYVGTIKINNDRLTIIPDDTKNLLIFNIEPHNGVVEGDKVLVRAGRYDKNIVYGFIDKIIGHKSDPGVEILSIVYDNGVNPEFDDALLENTRNITFGIDERNKKIRKNITHLPIITIDPATSKDFDDAVYVKKQGDKYLLSVSIADVSYYVKFKSKLDEEALKRGCSIYLVDRVIPMLPHNLSDDICSLNPNVERFTITCDILINNKGNFDKIDVYPSIIKSHRRFSYDEVNEYFSKKSSLPNDVQEIKDMLNDSFELHTILTDAKNKRGYIELNVPEPKIILDQNNIPIKIEKRTTGDAQKTIEDFMVAANEAVTIYAHKNNLPFIYRIHEKPSELKIENFKIEAKKLNFKITTDLENITSKDVRKWLEDNKTNPNSDLIDMILLRSMSKAKYSIDNLHHFGLASQNYTHFTSPIRRYPDLIVHRIYWMYMFDRISYTDIQREELKNLLKEYCEKSSENELVASRCEHEVNELEYTTYMSKHIGGIFNGRVISVNNFGIFVQLDILVEGFIKITNLGNDFYNYNEKSKTLIGAKTNKIITLGTKICVKTISANIITRKIEFELVNFCSW